MSARNVTFVPSGSVACSGAMYIGVPAVIETVRHVRCVTRVGRSLELVEGRSLFARWTTPIEPAPSSRRRS